MLPTCPPLYFLSLEGNITIQDNVEHLMGVGGGAVGQIICSESQKAILQ